MICADYIPPGGFSRYQRTEHSVGNRKAVNPDQPSPMAPISAISPVSTEIHLFLLPPLSKPPKSSWPAAPSLPLPNPPITNRPPSPLTPIRSSQSELADSIIPPSHWHNPPSPRVTPPIVPFNKDRGGRVLCFPQQMWGWSVGRPRATLFGERSSRRYQRLGIFGPDPRPLRCNYLGVLYQNALVDFISVSCFHLPTAVGSLSVLSVEGALFDERTLIASSLLYDIGSCRTSLFFDQAYQSPSIHFHQLPIEEASALGSSSFTKLNTERRNGYAPQLRSHAAAAVYRHGAQVPECPPPAHHGIDGYTVEAADE